VTARPRIVFFSLAAAVAICFVCLRSAETQSSLRRITNTTDEGISINPSISGDGRIIGFESTEDVAGAGGTNYFRAIRANISVDPPTFFQMGRTRADAPGISQDGSRIAFASKDDPLGTNADGNSEIFVFNGSNLVQVTNTTPGNPANRVTEGNFQPSMSDDGRFVAFSSNRNLTSQNGDGNLEVFVFDSVAAAFTQLTNSTGMVGFSDAKISGDGSAIACIRDPGATASTNRDLLRINRTTAAQTVLSLNVARLAMTYGRAVSDDGTRVAYSAETAANSTQVFYYDGRSGNVNRQVTTLGTRVTEVPLHPTISGDGRRIAFATRRALTGFSNSDASVELYTYDIPTGTFARITNVSNSDADCFDGSNAACEVVSSLSDDGSTVVFNFPRALSGTVTAGLENKSEIYATGLVSRPPFGTLTSILNQASLGHEPSPIKAVAPNSIAAAFGSVLANTTQQSQKQPNGDFPTNVGGTTVTVNSRAAQIFFVSPERVHFLVPPQTEIGNAEVVITNADGFASKGTVPVLRAAPGIFTKTGDGIGEGMILNADTLAEGPFDPSGGNLRLLIFSTGVRNGITRTVNIGGRVVTPEAVNESIEMPGLDEVIVRVPADLRGAGNVTLFITADGRDSNPVTVKFLGDPTRNVVINEVLADPPDGLAGDANHDGVRDGTQDEFVELVNGTSGEVISLGGWTIRTRATGSTTETTRFTFASGTSLPAGQAIVVFGGGSFNPSDTVFGCAQVVKATTTAGLSLTNSGVTVLIRDASGNLITEFSYGGSTGRDGDNNQSLTRSPDVTGTFVQHTTAGGVNPRQYSPGLKIDGTPFGSCPSILTSVTISPPSATINVGQTQQFTAQAFDQYGRAMTGVTITFSSDNTNVATVESVTMNSTTGVATATVKGQNPGVANITASATDGSNTLNSSPAVLTVSGPALSINDVSQSEGNAGTTTFTFTVTLSTVATAPVTFNIATQDNTATSASGDYVARSLTSQTIAAGQQTYTFGVTVNGDVVIEPTEAFFVNVSNVSGASVSDAQGVGTIVTDDIPLLSVNDVTREEGNTGTTTFTFTVSSNLPAPPEGITFDIATQDSSATVANNDYVARSLTAQSIPAGQSSYTFDVTVNGDTTVEPNETFFVNLSNVSANAGVADGQAVGTIQNDDAALLVISQVYGGGNNAGAPFRNDFVEIYNRGTTTVDFTLTPYSIQYAGVGNNFGGSQTNLTSGGIAPGKYYLVQEGGGTANGVVLPTPDATGSIALGNTSGKVALVAGTSPLQAAACPGDDLATPFNPNNSTIVDFVGYGGSPTTTGHCYEGAAPATAPSNTTADFRKAGGCVDTNENGADFFVASPNPRNSSSPAGNCQPEITINDVTVTEGNTGTVNATFTVSLSSASSQTVTVNFATADSTATLGGNDYQSNSGILTFNPGDLTKTITVLVNGDTLDEANENFFVNLSGAVNAVLLDSQGQGTISDNDPNPSLSVNDLSIDEGNSGTTAFTFTVTLSTASGQTVTVNFATADNTAGSASDYQSNSGSLTFIPGDTEESITVLVNGDGTFEPNETFFVNLSVPTNASISGAQGQGTITNDDAAPPTPTFFIDNLPNIAEGNSGTSVVTFTVTLSPTSGTTVTVDYTTANVTASDSSDYVATSGQLVFAPGDTSKQINVTINGDTLVEPDETFRVNLSNATGGAGIGTPFGTGTIKNDDAADLVISQTYPGGGLTGATFTHDYIELFNQGTTTVNLAVTPYSVQFLSTSASTWAKTDITSGTIAPGGYFLIQGASGGANGAALPTPNATGSLNLTSTTAGKVALVVGGTLLVNSCPGDDLAAPFNPVDGTIVDFVGYGGTAATANHCYEGSGPAPYTLSNNTTADFRKFGGCQDTNDNAADFATATPNPRNTSSPLNDCTAADLEITKTDSPDPVVVGSNVTYSITVTNHGPAAASSVVVTDNLPANVTFFSCAAPGGTCNAGSGNGRTITFASIAAGASEPITLVATANGPAGTQISNTATVSSNTTDPIGANNSATATTDVNNPTFADLSISKSDSPDPVFPTQTLTYTLIVTNNGPDTAQSVVVTDSLPSEVTFVNCASNQGGVCGGTANNRTINFASLANGATATITINVTVNSNVTAGTLITNNASVASATGDSNGGNNTTSATTTVQEVSAGQLVISEFRTRGPGTGSGSATDEFVEIYNPTTTTLVIGGLKIRASNNTGTISDRVTITAGTTLGPGCHYLVANSSAGGYSGATSPNQTYTTGIGDDGGIAITRNNGTTIIDQVGMSAGSAYKEGTTLTPLAGSANQSYERKPGGSFGNGTDTNNNSADFFLNASSSNPQNSSSGCLNTSTSDLSITNSDSPDPVTVGSDITYTITVTNNGIGTASNVVVTDNLPSSLTFVSCNSTGGGVCNGAGNNRTVNFSSLSVGASATITIVGTVNGTGGASISNTASVSSATSDLNGANDSATATTTVSSADLSVTKSDSPDPVNAGENITYTITVTNNSATIPAESVTVSDPLASNTTLVSVGATPAGWTRTDSTAIGATGTITYTKTTMAASATAIFTITVKVDSGAANNSTITNTASVSSNTPDDTPANNSAPATTTVRTPADLSLIKSVNNASPNVGDQVTFTITVSNAGPYAATGVLVKDILPAGLTYVSDDGSGSYTSGTGIWNVGTVNASASATLHITASVTSSAVSGVTNTAEITASDQFDPDSTPNNHVVSEDDQASATVTAKSADLSLTKIVDDSSPTLSQNVLFTVTLTNGGPNAATNVEVKDQLPAGLTFVSATPSQGSYNNSNGIWLVGTVNASSSATLEITATVTSSGTITNTAEVTACDVFDPDSTPNNHNAGEDDQASRSISSLQADLSLTKSVDNATPNVGSNVIFAVKLSNAGPDAATGVVVKDSLPAGLTFVSATPSQGSYNSSDGTWTVGSVSIGSDTATLSITATATSVSINGVINTAEVTACDVADPDSTPNNHNGTEDDQKSVTVNAKDADLSVVKTVDNATPNLGSNVVFTIKLSNGGTDAATGVVVNDALPAGLNIVSATPSQGTYNSGTGAWTVGTVSIGTDTATLSITATVATAGTKTNTAEITASAVFDPDSTPNNHNASEDDQSSVSVTPQQVADLSITKSDSPDPVAIGNDITYTITVTNAGPNTATSAILADTVPTNTTFRSISPPAGWTCPTQPAVGGTGAISCTNASFGVGSAIFTMVVRVGTSVVDGTIISNTASVSSGTSDPNPGSESATATTIVKQPSLVISQIYPGGGNGGATYTYDYVELFNRGTTTVDFSATNYSIQYAGTTAAFGAANTKVNITSGKIEPGQYFLVRLAPGAGTGTAAEPAPDANLGVIGMSTTAGKVALVLGTAAVSGTACPGATIPATTPTGNNIVDFVGYGATANCYQGTGPAPFSTSTAGGLDPDARSTIRTSSCTDTNNNASDFSNPTTAPVLRNTATTKVVCP
jgi:uncharacterized repeat protein (TIGR01451 family)